ncbi:MAG: histidinol-phosphatase [Kiritimatiellae bacterium]|nr:histidinol-phosphatase [Kiritimatiellia bacterium]
MIKANYHTHSTWCDGKDSPRKAIQAAIAKGFEAIGFSSHAMLPESDTDWVLTPDKAPRYQREIRALAEEFKERIRVLCGVEADYVPGGANPDRSTYAAIFPDYIIGSIHWVVAKDGARVPVDHTPELLADGIRDHFDGRAEAFVRAYYRQVRDMVANFRFDVVGHLDLVRKFNAKHPYFDEKADWYREEIGKTAAAVAKSGKIAEVNTGAISRGWMDNAYPSAEFREMLRAKGVKFILSSDAHAADAIDCAFDRFESAEEYVDFRSLT